MGGQQATPGSHTRLLPARKGVDDGLLSQGNPDERAFYPGFSQQ